MSESKVAYVFPGQGSQAVGMGYDLYKSSSAAREVFEEADDVLGFSMSRLCFEGPDAELAQTVNAQPAIVTVSLACLRASQEGDIPLQSSEPAYVAGHSLGEYTALVASNVLNFADTVRLVRERGRLMQEAGMRIPGGMAALTDLDVASIEEICQLAGAQIASINCSGQVVISGSKLALVWAIDMARRQGARRAIQLDVSGAFHSHLMQPAMKGMAQAISTFSLRDPAIPIVANTTARPVTTSEQVKHELVTQLCNCVLWQRSVEYMIQDGVSTFVELGPGQVLSGLIKRINQNVSTTNVNDCCTPRA